MDAYEIIKLISGSKKKTPVRALFKGDIGKCDFTTLAETYKGIDFVEVYDEFDSIRDFAAAHPEV